MMPFVTVTLTVSSRTTADSELVSFLSSELYWRHSHGLQVTFQIYKSILGCHTIFQDASHLPINTNFGFVVHPRHSLMVCGLYPRFWKVLSQFCHVNNCLATDTKPIFQQQGIKHAYQEELQHTIGLGAPPKTLQSTRFQETGLSISVGAAAGFPTAGPMLPVSWLIAGRLFPKA